MDTLLRRWAIVPVLWCTTAVLPDAACAQGNPLALSRLELRVVPQTGLPGDAGGVVDLAGTAHNQLLLADTDRKRRFEIQYRVTNLPAGLEFDGLQLASIDIVASVRGGSTGVSLGRALLSRDEAGGTGAPDVTVPPGPVDASPASSNGSRGLHRPFRGIIPAPPPNNDYSANGIIRPSGLLIDDVTPVTIAGSGQGALDAQGNLQWYGVYSFDADFGVGGSDQDADGFVNVIFDAQLFVSTNGTTWFGFLAGDPTGHAGTLHTDGQATVRVQVPGLSTGMVMVSGLLTVRRRRR